MCYPIRCKTCGKTTWGGCGSHVEAVRRGVPASDWCAGHHEDAVGTVRKRWWR
ncbi:hypothetical protein GOARA_076_00050 [Gordonia araii NBRC 100433]|uniref:Uncharacterized protein n=1 Tax=Gordonia araii NBRC 100433 TaxID=1073574 RepID=G7H6M1_9ACTN|nr:hypothetical protein [Gordonia araii]NNG98585.1 hypothetical protein [Gordonia araii NBRC 100433]GAB11496.1 hypothetical protein GOARA_076_00050 [Gordonia araii NBRC 100433]